MSRAFVKEQDDRPDDLFERPVSPNPNIVTARGLRLIEEEIEKARRRLAQGQHDGDRTQIAAASRDLRYWSQRRSTAQLRLASSDSVKVGFGMKVYIRRDDGRLQIFSIVGEDEAEPATGSIAYTSPMARSLLGRVKGEVVAVPGGEAEIVSLEPVGPEG